MKSTKMRPLRRVEVVDDRAHRLHLEAGPLVPVLETQASVGGAIAARLRARGQRDEKDAKRQKARENPHERRNGMGTRRPGQGTPRTPTLGCGERSWCSHDFQFWRGGLRFLQGR